MSVIPTGLAQELFCRLWMSTYLIGAFTAASGYNLTLLTIERFLAITQPMKYDVERVYNRLPYVLSMAWFIGIIVAGINWFLFYAEDDTCILIEETDPPILSHFVPIYIFVTHCLVPTIIMTVAYVGMGLTLR